MTWRVIVQSMIPVGQIGEQLYLISEDSAGLGPISYVSGPLVLKELAQGNVVPDDAVLMKGFAFGGRNQIDDLLQAFADAAWDRGIKPKKYEEPSNELSATKKHLEDCRALLWQEKNRRPPSDRFQING